MTSFPDPDQDGGYKFRAVNRNGLTASFGVTPESPPKAFIQLPALSSPFALLDVKGSPIMTVPPAGFAPPTLWTRLVSGIWDIDGSFGTYILDTNGGDLNATLPAANKPYWFTLIRRDSSGSGATCVVFPRGSDTINQGATVLNLDKDFVQFPIFTPGEGLWYSVRLNPDF